MTERKGAASNGDETTGENRGEATAPQTNDAGAVTTRRRFLAAAGASVAATAGVSQETSAQEETYEFGGEVQGWQGRAPAAIEGEVNPTLQLQAGTEYRVEWENLDGAPHDFTIQDANGGTITGTDTITEEGETATLTFTASPEMAQYICTIHPTTMVGEIQIAGGAQPNQGGGLPLDVLLMAGAMLAALLSPLAFAVLLYLNRGGDEQPAPRPGD